MKKQLIIAIVSLIPAIGFAKTDFGSIIADNVKAQDELHQAVRHDVDEARGTVAKKDVRERIVIVENSGVSYNAPTNKSLLAFKKEKTNFRPSEAKQFDRLANEIHSVDQ
jgi:hypothetical protein